MEKWIQGFKTDMKLAIRTVKSTWKTYSAIFAAVFLIQMMFGVIGLSRENSIQSERETILAKYDSHIELTGLNDGDYYYLLESANSQLEPYYEVILYNAEKSFYNVGIYFTVDPEFGLSSFLTQFSAMFEDHGTVYTQTPLYVFDTAGAGDGVRHAVLLAVMGGFGFVLLTILNNIRINHFKFDYGIYMTFGADFKRLGRSTVCESLFIFALTYLPAMLVAFLAVCLMTWIAGGKPYFTFMPFVWALIIPAIVTVLATVVPIRWLTMRRPSHVLLAQDNANQVISPRRSRMIFATKFPYVSESLSLFRFSGYVCKLAAAGTLFSLLFTCGIYAVGFYDGTLTIPTPQYTVNLSMPDEALVDKINDIDGLTALSGTKIAASEKFSHLLLSKELVSDSTDFMVYPHDKNLFATHKVIYHAADKSLPQALTQHFGYEVSGDPSAVLTDSQSIIISESLASRQVLDIKPGDTVYLAMYGGQSQRYDPNAVYSGQGLLRMHLENYTFTYREFTVAAVIHNEPSRDGICIYLPAETYCELTESDDTVWSVYADADLSDAEFEKADKELRGLLTYHSIQDHETRAMRQLSLSHNYTAVYTAVFCIVLALVPLIWFFSLILFNGKRRGELDVYRALGATQKELKRIFMLDGVVMAAVGAIFYTAAAPICTFYMRRVLTSDVFFIFFLRSYIDKHVYLSAYPALWVYIAGIVLTVLSAFFASYISYRIYHKAQSEHISENFSQEG
ncbi:MAG: FtsX-like permease family protein [Ruminococcaceae bacterium]|nr:FtsX-like permease family protein [Oscillospiraceae bacterium]